jgi:outer membrane protein TolC
MKKRVLILFILIMPFVSGLMAQKVLTLKECYEMARAATPIAAEGETYSQISAVKDKNLLKGWLPTLDASGSLIYNSSVVDMTEVLGSLPIPGIADLIKPLPHEQYKLTIDINQVIYDGGAVRNARALEKTDLSINRKQTETDLYKLRSQINTCYFNIILLEKRKELLNNYLELISKQIAALQSALSNGVITKSDIDILTSEKINLIQQLSENENLKGSLRKVLSSLTGSEIDSSAELILPSASDEMTKELSRPELELFDLRKEQLSAGLKALESKRMPKAFGFATLGYGNPPGNNYFKDEFAPYYMVGASIKWNIFDWNKTRNEKHLINLQQGVIENRKSDLTENLNRLLETKNAEIINLNSMLESDTALIAIRKRITASSESQYKNGTITATEFLNSMNSERQAMINYEIHKINLAMAKIEYLNISGKEIE